MKKPLTKKEIKKAQEDALLEELCAYYAALKKLEKDVSRSLSYLDELPAIAERSYWIPQETKQEVLAHLKRHPYVTFMSPLPEYDGISLVETMTRAYANATAFERTLMLFLERR